MLKGGLNNLTITSRYDQRLGGILRKAFVPRSDLSNVNKALPNLGTDPYQDTYQRGVMKNREFQECDYCLYNI